MVLPAFQRVVRACLKRGSFNVRALLASLEIMSDSAVQCIFDEDFDESVMVAWRSSGDTGALRVFCNNWMKLGDNKTLFWVIEAANTFDHELAVFIEEEMQKVLDDDSVDEAEKTEVRTIMERKYCQEKQQNFGVPPILASEPKLYGCFPVVNEENFLPPDEHERVKAFIRQLWRANLSRALLIQGDGGIGKSTEISALMHDKDFLKLLPGLEAVFWFQGYKHSTLTNSNDSTSLLRKLGELFREANLQVDDSSFDSLKNSLGSTKKYMLIIDDAQKYRLATLVSHLSLSTQCILISRKKPVGSYQSGSLIQSADDDFVLVSRKVPIKQPLGRCDSLIADMVCLKPNDDFIKQLYALKYQLPRIIMEDDKRMEQIVKITLGLPLIANIISKHFTAVTESNSERDVSWWYKQIVESTTENLHSTISDSELPPVIVANLLKCICKRLADEDRLRYYAFLFFDPGHSINSTILQRFWKVEPDDTKAATEICDRFVRNGLATRVGVDEYAIHAYLHNAAEKDAIQQGIAVDLNELRKKMVGGELMESRKFNHKVTWLFMGRPAWGNILHIAIHLQKWDIVEVLIESAEDAKLKALCFENTFGSHKVTPLQLLYKDHCPHTRQSQVAFLKIYDRLFHELVGEYREAALLEIGVIRYLYDHELRLNKTTLDGETALTLAAKDGQLAVLEYLDNRGVNLNEKNNNGSTALMVASFSGNLDVVEFLQSRGADLNVQNSNGLTALMLASFNGHLDVVRFLHSKGADLDAKYSNDAGATWTALMHASDNGHLDIVRFLHSQGADLNGKKTNGDTALIMASRYGILEIVQFLQDLGADLNVKDSYGNTALMLASGFGHLDVVKFLHSKGADFTLKNNTGQTALMMASSKGELQVVRFILENLNNINLDAKDDYGNTSLMLASDFGHLEVVSFLHSQGANLNVANKSGYTALTMASRYGEMGVVRFLQSQGVDLNAKTDDGLTALMIASIAGETEVVRFLHGHGVDLNAKTGDGSTALMLASRYGQLEIVKFLLGQGVDSNARNNKGRTALDLATNDPPFISGRREAERKEVANYLRINLNILND